MRNNAAPAWAIAALSDNDAQLRASVVPSMLPIELTDEIGCGGRGCAWRTLKKEVVFKITSDDSEYDFAMAVMDFPRPPRGVSRFYGAIELDVQATGNDACWDVFGIWREWAQETARNSLPSHDADLFDAVSCAYGRAIDLFCCRYKGSWPTTDNIRDASRNLSRTLVKEHARSGYVAHCDSNEALVVMHWLEDMLLDTSLRAVAQALRYFRVRRMLLYDVNEDNVGLFLRGHSDIYAIFDANLIDYR